MLIPRNIHPVSVGIIGASGAVGRETIHVLHKRQFPVRQLRLFASERSAGTTVETPFGNIVVENFSPEQAAQCQVILLAVSGEFAREYAPTLAKSTLVIDNSSAFRYDADIPLIIPEINGDRVAGHRLIANPNCTTAVAAMALWPLHRAFGLRKVIISTYQAASGAGAPAMAELLAETRNALDGRKPGHKIFQHPLPFNLIPHVDHFQDNGYTREEMKVVWETRKIFNEPDLPISATCVRIPILRAHSEAITIETEEPISPDEARAILSATPGVKLVDDPARQIYPMPLTASEQFDVEVGRVRQNLIFGPRGLDFFVSGDQLLKGAALNTIQIAEAALAV